MHGRLPGPQPRGLAARHQCAVTGHFARRCAIVGIGQTSFTKRSGQTELALAVQAIQLALEDAGIDRSEVDGVVKYTQDSSSELALVSALGLANLRFFGEVGYGGSAHAAVVGHAAAAIIAGLARTVVCFRALNERSGRRFGQSAYGATAAGVDAFTAPLGLVTPAQRFALFARRYMLETGAASEDFGRVAVTQRQHAQRNPAAMLRGHPLTLVEHQASRWIAEPLRLFDCSLETDGAVALVVTSADRARDTRQRPAFIAAAAQGTGADPHGIVFRPDLGRSLDAEATARALYEEADVGPADVDVALLYDHFSPFVLFGLEAYGFCGRGEAPAFVREGHTAWPDGDLPVNTHGGHLSEGYLHGLGHVLEAVRQVRGTSTCQVDSAEVALVGSAVAQVSSALILQP